MHPFFAGLEPFEVALLVTTLTVGGEGALDVLGALGDPMRSRLVERAQQLMNFAPEMRSSLMSHELKNLLALRRGYGLELIDPTWLIYRLRGEGPRMVGLILLGLPTPAMRAALKRLPAAVRRQLPAKAELMGVSRALAAQMRLLFATRFAPMPQPQPGAKNIRDLLFLERGELHRLVRSLGLIELGQAFAVMEKMALVELCRRLEKPDAHELIAAVQTASQVDMPDKKTAHHFLSKVVVNFEDAEEFLLKSGLWRLARATIAEPEAWQRAMVQRLPRRIGLLLNDHWTRARELELAADTALCGRLQDAILVNVQLMARAGHVSKQWATGQVSYHDPAACEAALLATPPPPGAASLGSGRIFGEVEGQADPAEQGAESGPSDPSSTGPQAGG